MTNSEPATPQCLATVPGTWATGDRCTRPAEHAPPHQSPRWEWTASWLVRRHAPIHGVSANCFAEWHDRCRACACVCHMEPA